jgi:hypothetical protein
MLVQDAYFKLTGYARQLTGRFNGALAGLIYAGPWRRQLVTATTATNRYIGSIIRPTRCDVLELGQDMLASLNSYEFVHEQRPGGLHGPPFFHCDFP